MVRKSFRAGWLAQIFYFLATLILAAGLRPWAPREFDWEVALVATLLALPLVLIGGLLGARDRRIGGEDLDAVARWSLENAVAAARRGEQLPVMLYLRPFSLGNRLRFRETRSMTEVLHPDALERDPVLDFETLIAEQLESSTPLVALGESGEHVGAGRVFSTDREWRQAVAKLSRAAARILVLPASSEGTLWEIGWLERNQMFGKCVFLLPPQPNASDVDMAAEWEEARRATAQLGLQLPDYEASGKLFTLKADATVSSQTALAGGDGKAFHRAVESLLPSPTNESGESHREAASAPAPQPRKRRTIPYLIFYGALLAGAYFLGPGSGEQRVGVHAEVGPFITVPGSWRVTETKQVPGVLVEDEDQTLLFLLVHEEVSEPVSAGALLDGVSTRAVEQEVLEVIQIFEPAALGAVVQAYEAGVVEGRVFVKAEARVPGLVSSYRVVYRIHASPVEQVLMIGLVKVGRDREPFREVVDSLEVKWRFPESVFDSEHAEESGVSKFDNFELTGNLRQPSLAQDIAFHGDFNHVASAGRDGKLRIWGEADPPMEVEAHTGAAFSIDFSPTGQAVVSGGEDGRVVLTRLGDPSEPSTIGQHSGPVRAIAFDPRGASIASAGEDGFIRFWAADGSGQLKATAAHQGAVNSLAFSPDGSRLVSGGQDGSVKLWSTQPDDHVVLGSHQGGVFSVAFHPDGQRVVSGGDDRFVRIWSLNEEAEASEFQATAPVLAVAFNPAGNLIAVGSSDGKLGFWPASGACAPVLLVGPVGGIWGVGFNRAGDVLATGGRGGVMIWRADEKGRPCNLP